MEAHDTDSDSENGRIHHLLTPHYGQDPSNLTQTEFSTTQQINSRADNLNQSESEKKQKQILEAVFYKAEQLEAANQQQQLTNEK